MPSRVIGGRPHHTGQTGRDGTLARARRLLEREGAVGAAAVAVMRAAAPLTRHAAPALARQRLAALVRRTAPATPLVMVSTLPWNHPYAQRPHHLARGLHAAGRPIIFITPSPAADRIVAARTIGRRLVVTPFLHDALDAVATPIVYLLSTDGRIDDALVDDIARRGGRVIYDFIDELDDAVSNVPITPARRQLHARLLADTRLCTVVVSATRLQQQVVALRPEGGTLITNGVDTAHFMAGGRARARLRGDLLAIAGRGRPIAGYFGALAGWLDYALLQSVAAARPDIAFVLIGPDYDGSARVLRGGPANVHVLKPVPYRRLPEHAARFDVALMPFALNAITEATSPLKLFEYFALGLPVVSTPIPEAAAIPDVLTARTTDEWVAALDRGLALRGDAAYRTRLRDLARANDWTNKSHALVSLLASIT